MTQRRAGAWTTVQAIDLHKRQERFAASWSLRYLLAGRKHLGMADPFDLERFVKAQTGTYDDALAELQQAKKSGHWMRFVFPKLRGLGRSAMSGRYGISSIDEARSHLEHPLLGPRLRVCTEAVNATEGRTALQIFGPPDDLKFHSSMTMFHLASPTTEQFATALHKYFEGRDDGLSLDLLYRNGG